MDTEPVTKDEFNAALMAKFGRPGQARNRDHIDPDDLSPDDVAEALPDYLRGHAGGKWARRVHPVADFALREKLSLDDLKTRSRMTAGDFGAAMEQSLTMLMVTRYDGFAADLPKFCRELPVSDFRPVGLASLDIQEPAEVPDDLPLASLNAKVTQAANDGILKQFGGKISFSRSVMSTYGTEIANGILAFASVFWSIEQKLVATLLAGASVTGATGTLSVAGLGAGAAAMRTGLNPAGQMTGLPVHSLMVGAGDEMAARVLLSAVEWPLGLTVNPYLAAGSYYLFANPALNPGVLRLTLRQQPAPRIYSDSREIQTTKFALSHDIAFALSASAASAIVRVAP